MKRVKILAIFCFCLILVFGGCKKKDENNSDSTPTPVNYLCDGNGKTVYYPLDSANNWKYSYKIGGTSQSVHPDISVTGHISYNGKTYSKLIDATSYFGDKYLREDITTHDIYYYSTYYSQEYMEIPATPVLNQSWTYYSTYTRKVTNLSASVSTSSCSYTGLLEISEYDGTTLKGKYYYKKGLGLVFIEKYSMYTSTYTLTSVTLK